MENDNLGGQTPNNPINPNDQAFPNMPQQQPEPQQAPFQAMPQMEQAPAPAPQPEVQPEPVTQVDPSDPASQIDAVAQAEAEMLAEEQGQDEALIDKLMRSNPLAKGNPFVKAGPETYEDVRTQSVIKSSREEAGEQLAQIEAYNANLAHQQKVAEEVNKAERTGIRIVVAIIFILVAGAAAWIIIGIIMASQNPVQPRGAKEEPMAIEYGNVGDYQCNDAKCGKVVDIDERQIIIKDGARYYIYNTETKEAVLSAIPEEDYHAIVPFQWGGKMYADLDPESSQSALFSITDNRQLTDFSYDVFYRNNDEGIYDEMTWVEGTYIVAKSSGLYRLVRLSDGKEVIYGAKRVFIHDDFLFSFESNNTVRLFNSSAEQFLVIDSNTPIFTNGSNLILFDSEDGFGYRVFDKAGKDDGNNESIVKLFENMSENQTHLSIISGNSSFYRIPNATK